MASLQDIIRRITIVGKAEGVDQVTGKLRELSGAQAAVAVANEKTSASALSMEKRLESLQRSLDAEYRAEQNLARINKELAAARAQGLISAQRQNELSTLAAAKFTAEGESAKRASEGLRTLREISAGFVAGIGAGIILTGIAELPGKIREAISAAGDLKDVAETIGITADNLQELQYAAEQAGISTESIDDAMVRFSKNLGDATIKGGELADILKANHIQISGNVQKDFLAYADLIERSANAQQRNALVTAAFGKSGAEMGRLFAEGSQGIRQAADEAHRLGAVLGDDALNKAKALDDEMASLGAQLDAAFKNFAISLGPAVLKTLQGIVGAVQALQGALKTLNPDQATIENRFRVTNGVFASPNIENRTDPNYKQTKDLAYLGKNPSFSDLSAFGTQKAPAPVALPPTKETEQAIKAYDKLIESSQKRIEGLKAEAEALGMTGVAADAFRNYTDLLSQAQSSGITITDGVIAKLHEQADAMAAAQQSLEGARLNEADRDPFQVMGDSIAELDEKLANGVISWRTYNLEVGKATEQMVGGFASAANDVLGNLETLTSSMGLEGKKAFEIQKGISIARAVVAGGEAIVHSYNAGAALPGGPVTGAIFAGIAAAATAAQIAAIASSTYQSKSVASTSSGSTAAVSASSSAPRQSTLIQLVGNSNSQVSLGDVKSLLDQLNDEASQSGMEIVTRFKGAA